MLITDWAHSKIGQGADVPERIYDAEIARHILEDMPIPVAYLDPDLTVTFCNAAGESLLGRVSGDIIGRGIADIVTAGSEILRALADTVGSRAPRSITFVRPAAPGDDDSRILVASLAPDIADDGSLRGVLVTAYEVTEQVTMLRRTAQFAESLNVILQSISGSTDPMELLDRLSEEALEALHGDYSLVSIRGGGSWVVTHHHGAGGEDRVGVEYPLEERPAIQEAVATGKVQYIEDALTDPRTNKRIMDRFGIRSFVAVPLVLRGETLGVFEIVYADRPHHFDEARRRYLDTLAGAASLAYGRMREYQHQQRIADTLQAALLRLPTAVGGIRFASHYAAASDEALVGGDFFDVFEIEPGRIGITIGDVSGKGLSAAIVTSRVRDCLRLCALDGLTPSECVSKTNRLLFRITPSDMFATLIFGILDTASGVLTYVAAAHPAGILQRRDGQMELLEGANSVVGGFPDLRFEERSVTLDRGDALVLYTDGLTEARRDGEMFGADRLVEFLEHRTRGSLEALVNEVLAAVRVYARGQLSDDVAMLAIALDRPVSPDDTASPSLGGGPVSAPA
jgi:GAF domain-containing protein